MQTLAVTARRTDIQGLRTVAVLSVVLFHIGGWLKTGYIGVDTFFVISGYVISMAYLDKFVKRPNFATAIDFFRRRILRLAPALIVVVVLTLAVTNVLLPPSENKLYAIRAGLAALTQTSNLFFSKIGTNYWLDTLSRNPFLHTWSLGVEWQFYAIVPIPFLVASMVKRHCTGLRLAPFALAALAATLIASLLLFLTDAAVTAFYGPWSRIWQFSLGICALLVTRRLNHAQSHPVFHFGLVVVLVALTLFPSTAISERSGSIVASFLTAALLCAAPPGTSISGRALNSSLFQYLGSASYSIYLTHWPVAVFGRLLIGDGLVCDVALIATTVASGVLLSQTIEYSLANTTRPLRASIACLAAVGVAFVCSRSAGAIPKLPWYANPPLVSGVDGFHNFWWTEVDGGRDLYSHSATFNSGGLYRRWVPDMDLYEARAARGSSGRTIVGVGNSYIQSSGAMLRHYAIDENADLDLFHISNCSIDNEARCRRAFNYVAEALASKKDQISLIYVAFRGLAGSEMVVTFVSDLISKLDHPGLRVVLQGPSPKFVDREPLQCLRLFRPCSMRETVTVDQEALESGEKKLARMFGSNREIRIWSPYRSLCDGSACLIRESGSSMVMDNDHFSNSGQLYLYPALRKFLAH